MMRIEKRDQAGGLGRAVRVTAIAGVLTLAVGACGSADGAGSGSSGESLTGAELVAAAKECNSITWYASSDSDLVERISDDFEKEYGVKVDWVEAGSADVASRLLTEARAGGTKADVVTGPIETIAPLADQDMFAEFNGEHIGDVDPAIVESLDEYAKFSSPFAMGAFGIVYNTDRVKGDEAPTSWADFQDDRWAGKMAAADARYGVTYATVIDFLSQKYGWEYWDKVGPNIRLARGGGDTQALLVTGEVDALTYAGFSIAHVAIRDDDAPIAMVVPEEGLQIYTTVSAVTAETDCASAAQLLVNHMTDSAAQEMIGEYGYYAANASVATPEGLPALKDISWQPTEWKAVSDPAQYEEIIDQFEKSLKK